MRSFYQIFTGWEELRRRLRDELGQFGRCGRALGTPAPILLTASRPTRACLRVGRIKPQNTKSCDGSAHILARLYLSRNCPACWSVLLYKAPTSLLTHPARASAAHDGGPSPDCSALR